MELFVMVMGASNYTYAEATYSQKLPDFVGSTIRGLEYFCAAPEVLVPDQLRSAVKGPDRYEPDINATYLEMAQHYGVTVIPARPGKPKDKAMVETAVLIVQRWILARLRHRTFFEIEELNHAIRELLEELNERSFQKLDGTRRSCFEELNKPAMRALPRVRYEFAERKNVKVNIDYHVEYDRRYYSVPYTHVHAQAEVRATLNTIEIANGLSGTTVDSHAASKRPSSPPVQRSTMCSANQGAASTRQPSGSLPLDWIKSKHNVVVVGKTGVGKSYLASALADSACRNGYRSLFFRVPRLLEELALARAAGQYGALLSKLSRIEVLILDDFLLTPLSDVKRRDLLEVLEDRYDRSSTVVATQVPTKTWHEALADPTIADAICDRLVHNAHVVKLGGPSIRERKALQNQPQPTA